MDGEEGLFKCIYIVDVFDSMCGYFFVSDEDVWFDDRFY